MIKNGIDDFTVEKAIRKGNNPKYSYFVKYKSAYHTKKISFPRKKKFNICLVVEGLGSNNLAEKIQSFNSQTLGI